MLPAWECRAADEVTGQGLAWKSKVRGAQAGGMRYLGDSGRWCGRGSLHSSQCCEGGCRGGAARAQQKPLRPVLSETGT